MLQHMTFQCPLQVGNLFAQLTTSQLGESSESLAKTAAALPDELQTLVSSTLKEVEAGQMLSLRSAKVRNVELIEGADQETVQFRR